MCSRVSWVRLLTCGWAAARYSAKHDQAVGAQVDGAGRSVAAAVVR